MRPLGYSEARGRAEDLPTLATLTQFLSRMSSRVWPERGVATESLLTLRTFAGFLTSMGSHMDAKEGRITKCFPTFFTFIAFHACVIPLSTQVRIPSDGFSTQTVFMGLLSRLSWCPFPAGKWFFPNFIPLSRGLFGFKLRILVCTGVLEKSPLPGSQLLLGEQAGLAEMIPHRSQVPVVLQYHILV